MALNAPDLSKDDEMSASHSGLDESQAGLARLDQHRKKNALDLRNNANNASTLARAGQFSVEQMGKKYESFILRKAPQLDSIPNFTMDQFVAASAYTRSLAQETLLLLRDHGHTSGNIEQHLRR